MTETILKLLLPQSHVYMQKNISLLGKEGIMFCDSIVAEWDDRGHRVEANSLYVWNWYVSLLFSISAQRF